MPTSSRRGNAMLLVAFLLTVSIGGCGRADAGDAEGEERPEADAPVSSASVQPSQAPAEPAATPSASGAEAEEAPAEPASARVVAEGMTLAFTVDQTISTDKQKVGDLFTATLAEAVVAADGADILTAGTQGRWVVTESTEKNAEGQAVIAVALEAVEVGGVWYPASATVTDISLKTDTPDSGKETAAKIGIGAAAGALAGKILGGSTEATLKGAGAGAAIGTAVALATRGGSAQIPQGSRITVTLNEGLELPPS